MSAFVPREDKAAYLSRRGLARRIVDKGYLYGEDGPDYTPFLVEEWEVGGQWWELDTAYTAQAARDLHALLLREMEAGR